MMTACFVPLLLLLFVLWPQEALRAYACGGRFNPKNFQEPKNISLVSMKLKNIGLFMAFYTGQT